MIDREVLLKMKDILERIFATEDVSDNKRIACAYGLIIQELSKPECEASDIILTTLGYIMEPIFKEHGLPPVHLLEIFS
jgi:hypothetical protein